MAAWVETLHPREAKGSPTGGQFAPKGGGAEAGGGWQIDGDDIAEIERYTHYASPGDALDAVKAGKLSDGTDASDDEDLAREHYIGGFAYNLNIALRNNAQLNDSQQGIKEGLDSLFKRSRLSEDTALYRYVGKAVDGKFATLEPNDVIRDEGYMSTSAAPLPASGTIKILAPKGSRALVAPQDISIEMNEVILDRGSKLQFVGEDENGQRVFRLQQDITLKREPEPKFEAQKTELKATKSGAATQKLLDSLRSRHEFLDVTGFESEGAVGFLTPDGDAINTDLSHYDAAKAAGTSLAELYKEGTARLYASSGFLGIEIHKRPTEEQIRELQKFARMGAYDRFAIDRDVPWAGHEDLQEGRVTPKVVIDTINKAFPEGMKTALDFTNISAVGLYGRGLETADKIKAEWQKISPYTDKDSILASAKKYQHELSAVGAHLEKKLGAKFINPGHKEEKSLLRKLNNGRTPQSITDAVRGGFIVNSPEHGEQVMKELANQFQLADEDWQLTPDNYFDRKVIVRFDDGSLGEIQMWHPEMYEAKHVKGGALLYDKARVLKQDDPQRIAYSKEMRKLYGDVLRKLSSPWKALVGKEIND